jgi:hypothetical protein
LQDDEDTFHRVEEGIRRRLPDDRNFRAETVDVEDPSVNVPDAIEVISRGEMVIICDDADQESEGDLMMAVELITPEDTNFSATHGTSRRFGGGG